METTAGPENTQQCSSCDESSAKCWCLDCNEALCDICLSAHRRVTITRSHRILDQLPAGGVSSPPPAPPVKFCRLHPSEQLKLYCVTCDQLTCRDCQLMAHISHRYQFVSEVLDGVKKQLQVWVQPLRAHGDTVRQSLLDMETRMQDIIEAEANVKVELQQSYNFITERLKNRMENILKETQVVYELECKKIQRRMKKLKQLQQNQQSVTETAEKAQNTSDLSALLAYRAQIRSQLKHFPEQGFGPPQTMCQLKVVTDRKCLETVLKFGALEVSWIPFSVSQTSNLNRDTPAAASCRLLIQTTSPADADSTVPVSGASAPWKSSSGQSSVNQSGFPRTTTTTTAMPLSQTVKRRPYSRRSSHLRTIPTQALLPMTRVQVVSPSVNLQPVSFGVSLPAGLSLPCTVLKLFQPSLVLNRPTTFHQNQPTAVLLPNSQTVYQVSCVPRVPTLPSQTASNNLPNHQPLRDGSCMAITSGPVSPPRCHISGTGPGSSSLEESPVVSAVADSACGRRVQRVAVGRRQPAENEPTSTVSEETAPAEKPSPPEASNREAGDPSQRQPRVSLFRLPVSPPRPGCPLPAFRLIPGDDEDEIYLEEIREDTQSLADDVTDDIKEPPSSPESPGTLRIVSCSACGSAYGSIICSACGRGYHRDCHVPPVGPDMWSEWTCSLCQDLSDPSDPYSSERPQRLQSPCLSLLDQRRCESLLLHLKVEGCSRLSEVGFVWSRLKSMSERLTLRRSPSYQTAAEFLSDVWSLFGDAAKDDGALNKLQESFQSRLMETFSSELHSELTPPSSSSTDRRHKNGSEVTPEEQEVIANGSEVTPEEQEVIANGSEVTPEEQEVTASRSNGSEMRKRLRQLLDLVGTSGSKRRKTDKMEE
ncbi:transcription intermediary factor 1-beta isoform X2 [Chelmon rostratus]|uniref:transcription intermediary factor 1-beta isoform X2 n=1 Tax=Chelmon rostratus TaxID=109905 RepID=UPI001BE84875|nr:transcription intermediary factor 1-beta isoform X2 [Chelmon rostratus]